MRRKATGLPRHGQGAKYAGTTKVAGFCALTFALLFPAACGPGAKPKSQNQSQATPVQRPQATPNKSASPLPLVIGPVEKQSTSVLTRSVARVLGFADVGGRTVTAYQDAYSAL